MGFKITYSVLEADMTAVHAAFDDALAQARGQLGAEAPSWIGGKPVRTGRLIESHNPSRTKEVLARAHAVDASVLDEAVANARRAQREWAAMGWQARVAGVRRVAELISERRMLFAAIMSMEVGKNRLESLGDGEEAADLLRYYAGIVEANEGFIKPMTRLSPNEDVRSVLRPYGVFAVIAPFNFPAALPCGMTGGALLGGNAVLLKPSEETPWCTEMLAGCFADAGLPAGLFQVLQGTGETIGAALIAHPGIDGCAFTGSSAVGHHIFRSMTAERIKPVLLEMGGKNPAIIADDADLDRAVEGCYRSVFGLSGQKCSALSRIYVHDSLADEFTRRLAERAAAMRIGDPTDRDVYMGPVINAESVARYEKASAAARADGTVHFGGERLREGAFAEGHFVAPTIVTVPRDHWLEKTELFLPFVTVSPFSDLNDALARANAVEYGLTAGFYSRDPARVAWFLDGIEAGVTYTNRAAGATTGAWPGVQPFCGWKRSGSTGKGGCGPYYVTQFMREQSRTQVG
ncbi:MAG: aldehyde dehydrogenase family protein [Myxococcales bacterium]|nr:aldehyde dehydrogenase family protein [Myxococcales bacterium]